SGASRACTPRSSPKALWPAGWPRSSSADRSPPDGARSAPQGAAQRGCGGDRDAPSDTDATLPEDRVTENQPHGDPDRRQQDPPEPGGERSDRPRLQEGGTALGER